MTFKEILKENSILKDEDAIERIAEDLKYFDFDMREVYLTYIIKLESKLRGIYFSNKKEKDIQIELSKIINEFIKHYALYKDELIKLFNRNLTKKSHLKIDDENIKYFLHIFRIARNFVMHGGENIFQYEILEANISHLFKDGSNIKNTEIKNDLNSKVFNSKIIMCISNNEIRNGKFLIFPPLLIILAKTNSSTNARAILANIDYKINKYFAKTANIWKKDKNQNRQNTFFNKLIGLKVNWVEELF